MVKCGSVTIVRTPTDPGLHPQTGRFVGAFANVAFIVGSGLRLDLAHSELIVAMRPRPVVRSRACLSNTAPRPVCCLLFFRYIETKNTCMTTPTTNESVRCTVTFLECLRLPGFWWDGVVLRSVCRGGRRGCSTSPNTIAPNRAAAARA